MIRSFYIDNFKSLVDFRLPPRQQALGQFVCLVGLNGAGKSTVLQSLDFLAHMAIGFVEGWLDVREWKKADLTSRFLKRHVIQFEVEIEVSPLGRIVWEGTFNSVQLRCTRERITANGSVVLNLADQKLSAVSALAEKTGNSHELHPFDMQGLQYEGSSLSILKSMQWHSAIEVVRDTMESVRALDLLSPHSIRRRAKKAMDIGYGGERLSAYLHGLRKENKEKLLTKLSEFYPQVKALTTKSLPAGWKDLSVGEVYKDASGKSLETAVRHVSDGLLRVLAVLSQVESLDSISYFQAIDVLDQRLPVSSVLFDEIENGINPELMGRLVQHLLHARCQVFVTTHSPLILNYLPDEVARESVIFLYRNPAGLTRAVRLFDLPSVRRKLELLGPGEVYVDTDLTILPQEAETVLLQGATT
jgi:predicted ATPase